MKKQKVVFFGPKNKQTQKVLALFGIFDFEIKEEPKTFFEFKNQILEKGTQFIFLKLDKNFEKEIEEYFFVNYKSLYKVRTSISFLKFNFKKGVWYLEAVRIPQE